MRRKIPFTRLYHSDFLAITSGLTDAEVGKIVRALAKRGMGFPEQSIPDKIRFIFESFANLQNEDIEKYKEQIVKSQKGGSAKAKSQASRRQCQPEPEPEPEYTPIPPTGNPQSAPLAVGGSPPPDRGDFGDFWEKWPKSRRSSRPKAQKSYEKAIKSGVSHEQIIDGLQRHRAVWGQWSSHDEQFIPHPATWLNQERWNDPPPAPRAAGRPAETHRQPHKPNRQHAKEF